MISGCIVCNLTTKHMPNFWLVNGRIEDKLIELHFRCHMPATRLGHRTCGNV